MHYFYVFYSERNQNLDDDSAVDPDDEPRSPPVNAASDWPRVEAAASVPDEKPGPVNPSALGDTCPPGTGIGCENPVWALNKNNWFLVSKEILSK